MPSLHEYSETPPPTSELATRALAYLLSRQCMTLATHGPEGLWAASVFYVNLGFKLYFVSRADTRHVRNITATAEVAATITDEAAADWPSIRGIQLEGVAGPVQAPHRRDILALFSRRFAFVDHLWAWTSTTGATAAECVYSVRPSRLFFVDHRIHAARAELPKSYLELELPVEAGV
ncbi:MAG TPA: pyridoxamine 5'-phosphate oxidase family protein [Gaiellaceae bacterium]